MNTKLWQWLMPAPMVVALVIALHGGNLLAAAACFVGALILWQYAIVERERDELEREHDALVAAALHLYWSGYWECKQLPDVEQAQIWIELRDALGLPAGTSPARSVGRA